MYCNIRKRAIEEGKYLIRNEATIRETAKAFGLGKTTVHKDVTCRLMKIDKNMALKVRVILDKNTEERHIRGGEALRLKHKRARGGM